MIKAKEVEFNPYGVRIEDISQATHIAIGVVGLNLLQGDPNFSSLLRHNKIGPNLTSNQKRAALFARVKGLIQQNPH